MSDRAYKADAVIIGGGLAGLVTAIELLDHNKRVVLIERAGRERLGGLARLSFGGVFLVGSPEQKRAGIRDSVDLALRDWLAYGELTEADEWPRRWAAEYVAASRDWVRQWLVARGVKFFPVVNWVERGLHQPGNSVPRFHIVWGTGQGLVLALLKHLESHPRRDQLALYFNHRVTNFTQTNGRFTGCGGINEATGAAFNWKIAKKELAVSGSEFNHALRDKQLIKFLGTLLTGNTALVREFVTNCEDFVTANSVAELAEKMNALTGTNDVDAALLGEEVRRYDKQIERGTWLHNDDQLRRIAHARQYRGDRIRTCKFAKIDDARSRPLIAIREFILTRKSLGGIQTDLQSRVLGFDGEPLPGLYAVGEAAGFGGGGIHGLRSLEGTFLGGCIFGGHTAGQAIATG